MLTIDLGDGVFLPIKQVEPAEDTNHENDQTLQARLAVCAGGTTPSIDWPTNNTNATRFGPNDFGPISAPNT